MDLNGSIPVVKELRTILKKSGSRRPGFNAHPWSRLQGPFLYLNFLTTAWIFWRNWFNVLTADGFLFHWGGVADKCAKWISRCDRKKNKLKKFIFPNFQHSLALIHPKWISPKNSNIFRKIFFINPKRKIVVQIINRISNKQNLIQHIKAIFTISNTSWKFRNLKTSLIHVRDTIYNKILLLRRSRRKKQCFVDIVIPTFFHFDNGTQMCWR